MRSIKNTTLPLALHHLSMDYIILRDNVAELIAHERPIGHFHAILLRGTVEMIRHEENKADEPIISRVFGNIKLNVGENIQGRAQKHCMGGPADCAEGQASRQTS